jgi:uridylate kinase
MLATILNALALQDALEKLGIVTRTQSAIEIHQVVRLLSAGGQFAIWKKGRVVIFAAGTGNPYMTTDTAAALRAVEIEAEVLVNGKK